MKAIYLDVIAPDNSFICQLTYVGTPKLTKFGKGFLPAYDKRDLRRFVLSKRPTLKNVDFTIEQTNNRL